MERRVASSEPRTIVPSRSIYNVPSSSYTLKPFSLSQAREGFLTDEVYYRHIRKLVLKPCALRTPAFLSSSKHYVTVFTHPMFLAAASGQPLMLAAGHYIKFHFGIRQKTAAAPAEVVVKGEFFPNALFS